MSKTRHKLGVVIGIALIAIGSVWGLHHRQPKPNPNPVCHINGQLPDPKCTPGSLYLGVTQSNIHSTICVRGWTKTIRPSLSYTAPLKIQSIKDYGYAVTNTKFYEEDHFIPLELGGNPTDVKNLWAQPGASPNKKDGVENLLRSRVCAGVISLTQAQHEMSTDWTNIK